MRALAVCVGRTAPLVAGGRSVLSAIGKNPVAHDVAVRRLGLEGDEQADPSLHGGLSKAVYAYPAEHHAVWRTLRAQAGVAAWDAPVPFGAFGENLTIEGLVETRAWVGDVLRFPRCVLAVSEPRFPCFKFDAAMGFAHAGRMMAQSATCGFYLGVIESGVIRAGEAFVLEPGPREVSIDEIFRARRRR